MRAIRVDRFGGPEVLALRELPDPAPGPGQMVVAASACDVLFVDTMIRSGRGADYFPIRPPYIPGNGMGGTVAAVGTGVDPSWRGRQVVAHTGSAGGGGGYAEFATCDLDACALVPDGVNLPAAVAVLHDGTTALRILEKIGIGRDELVLVLGAAGGMGVLLVQLLAARGAQVIGAARGRAKHEVITNAGAHAVVDYSHAGWTRAVLEATEGRHPSVVLDGVGGDIGADAFQLIADSGRFSAHGSPSGSAACIDPAAAHARGIVLTTIADLQYQPGDRHRLLTRILGDVASGRVQPVIGQTFPLADAAKAHTAIEARETLAKTLLLPESR